MNFPEELSDSAYFRINMLYFRYLKKDQNHIFTSHYQILYLRQLALHTTSSRLKGASEKTRPRTKEFHQAIHPRPTLSPLFRPVYRHRLRQAVKRHPERRYTAKRSMKIEKRQRSHHTHGKPQARHPAPPVRQAGMAGNPPKKNTGRIAAARHNGVRSRLPTVAGNG